MPRLAGADAAIIGRLLRAAGIAAGHVADSFQLLKGRFGAPEAAAGEDGGGG